MLWLWGILPIVVAEIHSYGASGSPQNVFFNEGFEHPDPASSADAAKVKNLEFFFTQHEGYGVEDISQDLRFLKTFPDPNIEGATVDVYQQTIAGRPVLGGELKVMYGEDGKIMGVNGVTLPVSTVSDKEPVISARAAATIAVNHIEQLLDTSASLHVAADELMVYRRGLTSGVSLSDHLVHQVTVVDQHGSQHVVLVDAHTGVCVEEHTNVHSLLMEVKASNGGYLYNDSYFDGQRSTQVAVNASKKVYDLFFNLLGYASFNNQDGKMKSVAQASCIPNVGAQWDGTQVNYCPSLAESDLLAHEWAHAYGPLMDGLIYHSQAGMLEESFCDIIAASIEILSPDEIIPGGGINIDKRPADWVEDNCWDGPATSSRWVLGERFTLGTSQQGFPYAGVIDMWNPVCVVGFPLTHPLFPKPCPSNISQMICLAADNGMVHSNAALPDRVFALSVDGFGTYTGMGVEKALGVYLRAKLTCQTSTTTLAYHAGCLLQACNSLMNQNVKVKDPRTGLPFAIVNPADCQTLSAAIDLVGLKNTNVCGSNAYPQGFGVAGLYPTTFSRQGGLMQINIQGPYSSYVYVKIGNFYVGTSLSTDSVPGRVVTFQVPTRNLIPESGGDKEPVCISLDQIRWVCNYLDGSPMTMRFYKNPLVTAVNPPQGSVAGFNLTIAGQNFQQFTGCNSPSQGLVSTTNDCLHVTLDGIALTILAVNTTQIVVEAPPVASPRTSTLAITLDSRAYFTVPITVQYIYLAYLTSLDVYGCGDLSPPFSPTTFFYTCNVTNVRATSMYGQPAYTDVENVTVHWTADSVPTVSTDGDTGLITGSNILSVYVTSEDNSGHTVYQVILNREKSVNRRLRSITFGGGYCSNMQPAFNPWDIEYRCDIPFVVEALLPSAIADNAAAAINIDGSAFTALQVGVNQAIVTVKPEIDVGIYDLNLLATDPYYVPVNDYIINVNRLPNMDTRLQGLEIAFPNLGICRLSPLFDPNIQDYVCGAPQMITKVTYTAAAIYTAETFIVPDSSFQIQSQGWPVPGGNQAKNFNISFTVYSNSNNSWNTQYRVQIVVPSFAEWSSNDQFQTEEPYYFACAITHVKNWQNGMATYVPDAVQKIIAPNITWVPEPFPNIYCSSYYTIMFPFDAAEALCTTAFWCYNSSRNFACKEAGTGTAYIIPSEQAQFPFTGLAHQLHYCINFLNEPNPDDSALQSLVVDTGNPRYPCTLTPAFNPNILNYSCSVYHTIATTTIQALPRNDLASLVNYTRPLNPESPILVATPYMQLGQTVSVTLQGAFFLAQVNGTNTYTTNASNYTYTVYITRRGDEVTRLNNVTIDGVAQFEPPFDPYVSGSYIVRVPYNVSTLPAVHAIPQYPGLVVPNSWNQNMALAVLVPNKFSITVTSESMEANASYDFTVLRAEKNYNKLASLSIWVNNTLTGYAIRAFSPSFDALTTSYTCIVNRETTDVLIYATAEDPDATVEIAGNTGLAPGNNYVAVTVTAKDGFSVRTYMILVLRASNDATLSALSVANCIFSPSFNPTPFNPATRTYVCSGIYNGSNLPGAINVTLASPGANYTISRRSPATSGVNQISIVVTAENQKTYLIYSVYFYKDTIAPNACSDPAACRTKDQGGICVNLVTTYGCVCSNKWQGPHCDVAVVTGRRLLSIEPNNQNSASVEVASTRRQREEITVSRKLLGVSTSTDLKALNVSSCAGIVYYTGIYNYECNMPYTLDTTNVTVTTVSPTAVVNISRVLPGFYTIQGVGGATYQVTKLQADATAQVTIRVTDGGYTDTYMVYVSRPYNNNNMASSVSISNCTLSPAFDPDVTEGYYCQVPAYVTQAAITYTLAEPLATATVQGGTNLQFDMDNAAILTITALDGSLLSYKFTILRGLSSNDQVTGITTDCVGGLVPPFSPTVLSYYCTLNYTSGPDMTLDFQTDRFASVETNLTNRDLLIGLNDVIAKVVAQNGNSQTFIFRVNRKPDPTMTNVSVAYALSIVNCTFDKPFESEVFEYACIAPFPNSRKNVTLGTDVIVSTSDPGASVTLSGTIKVLTVNVLSIIVLARDGVTSTTYTVNVTRYSSADNLLSVLTTNVPECQNITLTTIRVYTCNVPYARKTLTLTAIPRDPEATFDMSSPLSQASLTANRNLTVGTPTVFQVIVYASDGKTFTTYTLNVIRSRPSAISTLASLSVVNCTLSPNFDPAVTAYQCIVPQGQSKVTVMPGPKDAYATVVTTIPTKTVSTDPVDLYFGRNLVTVKLTSQDGSSISSYSITITRSYESSLTGKTLNVATLDFITLSFSGLVPAVNPLSISDAITFSDKLVQAMQGLPGMAPWRSGVVGLRTGPGGAVVADYAVAGWDGTSGISDAPSSTLETIISTALASYVTGNGPFTSNSVLNKIPATAGPAFTTTTMYVIQGVPSEFMGATPAGGFEPTTSPTANSLSAGTLAGIIIGALILLVLLICVGRCCYKARQEHKQHIGLDDEGGGVAKEEHTAHEEHHKEERKKDEHKSKKGEVALVEL